jgi:hypothetical protein
MSVAEKLTTIAENQQKVFDAGARSEYDRLWDALQMNGTRTVYAIGFAGHCWTDDVFDPKYPITATTNATYMFWNSRITEIKQPVHVPTGAMNNTNIFNNASNLVTISKLVVAETSAYSASSWTGCTKLENLTIEGVIANNFPISGASKLTRTSLMSIIDHLKDFSGTDETRTLTLGSSNLGRLTDEDKKKATDKGWTLA